ncbi:MAG: BON domain-containing protein [Bacteriovoracaceae bacterium]|nr:BON domain-containing protein [Bacteriovoracaceae bacterium]
MDRELESKHPEKKRKLKLVEKYDNDDYSRFAGPDYSDEPFEIGESDLTHSAHQVREGSWHHPGVSGKVDDHKQTNFVGFGPKNYKRSDERIYEEVCETLMSDPQVDASNIGVKVQSGIVYLSGKVDGRVMKRNAELAIENLPGVQDVRNELNIFSASQDAEGPDSATKKDLGIS